MKVGNIVSRAGIEPIPLAFWTSMLTITLTRLPEVTMLSMHCCIVAIVAPPIFKSELVITGCDLHGTH